ncbi:MAG TPA: MFS transporter [Candidatus Ornithospirochaeta stercorigallinarum]|nr:MFS transporter [Candidatus Ornithospirochaeta stercorigallinarum]
MEAVKKEKKSLKGYWLTTFLIGLGFFTMGLMDPLYDNYVPIFLGYYIEQNSLIGLVMTLDNILAIILIPIFSALSDKTRTRIGRRMPYIVTLLPISAVFFALVPVMAYKSLILLVVTIFMLNISKQAVRGPVVALMPDMVPGDLRSEANGVINTMGGIATILGTILLARLMDVFIHVPGLGNVDKVLAFPVASVFVILAVVLLFVFVKENRSKVSTKEDREEKNNEPIIKSLKAVIGEKEKSVLFILLSLLCWFIAYQGILPFVGKYTTEVLGTSAGTAALSSGMVGVAYAIFAVPSGKFAHKHGRKKTIRWALIAIVIVLLLVFIHSAFLTNLPSMVRLLSFWVLLFFFGIFWVTVVTNSFPMLWQMADYKTIGIYTGLYYFFSQAASIISPPLAGGATDLWGYPALFLYGLVFMLIAYLLMSKVNRGEPEDD